MPRAQHIADDKKAFKAGNKSNSKKPPRNQIDAGHAPTNNTLVQSGQHEISPFHLLHLQQTAGNRAANRLFAKRGESTAYPIQAKLKLGGTTDPFELEANNASHDVIKKQDHPSQPNIQLKAQSGHSQQLGVGHQFEDQMAASRGSPIPEETKDLMESRFKTDFSSVNLHTDSHSAQLNKVVNAQALTHGNDIYFAEAKPNFNSNAGKSLLAHELTHVIQQRTDSAAQATVQPRVEGDLATDTKVWDNVDSRICYIHRLSTSQTSTYIVKLQPGQVDINDRYHRHFDELNLTPPARQEENLHIPEGITNDTPIIDDVTPRREEKRKREKKKEERKSDKKHHKKHSKDRDDKKKHKKKKEKKDRKRKRSNSGEGIENYDTSKLTSALDAQDNASYGPLPEFPPSQIGVGLSLEGNDAYGPVRPPHMQSNSTKQQVKYGPSLDDMRPVPKKKKVEPQRQAPRRNPQELLQDAARRYPRTGRLHNELLDGIIRGNITIRKFQEGTHPWLTTSRGDHIYLNISSGGWTITGIELQGQASMSKDTSGRQFRLR
jgi:hypothetical protein